MSKKKEHAHSEAALDEHYLGNCWKEYLNDVVPDDAGITQITETNHAFMAGAAVMMNGFQRSPVELANEQEFEQFMMDIVSAIEAYVDGIGKD